MWMGYTAYGMLAPKPDDRTSQSYYVRRGRFAS